MLAPTILKLFATMSDDDSHSNHDMSSLKVSPNRSAINDIIIDDVDAPIEYRPLSPSKKIALSILQLNTVVSLLQGYMGVYCAFSLIAIVSPQIVASGRISATELGTILSIARFVRIVPKLLGGLFVDLFGGKSMFVFGSLMTGVSAALFGLSGVADDILSESGGLPRWVLLTWACVALVSMQVGTVFGWGSIIKSAGVWFSYKSLGKAMSILALSYLFGDGLARSYLSLCIYLGLGWDGVSLVSGGTILFTAFIVLIFLQSSPTDCGLPEPMADPDNSLGEEGNNSSLVNWDPSFSKKANLQRIVQPFITIAKLPLFWLALTWYTILTLVRYIFLDWWSLYMVQILHASPSIGGFSSMIFPFAGGFGSLLFGTVADRLRPYPTLQYGTMVSSQVILLVLLLLLWITHNSVDPTIYLAGTFTYIPILILIFFIGVCTIAPYSLSSLISLRIGGKKLCSTVANVFDGFASIASMLSGLMGGYLVNDKSASGWSYLFAIGIVSNIISILCLVFIMIMMEWKETESKQRVPLNRKNSEVSLPK